MRTHRTALIDRLKLSQSQEDMILLPNATIRNKGSQAFHSHPTLNHGYTLTTDYQALLIWSHA